MKTFISYTEAIDFIGTHVSRTGVEKRPLIQLTGCVLAADLTARVHSPSVDASLKDGYAVRSHDLAEAAMERPVRLVQVGTVTAGRKTAIHLEPGQTIRITTGSPIPKGADAVLSEEYTTCEKNIITCTNTAEPDRNILFQGSDIRKGQSVAGKGTLITPSLTGLIATAGLDGARVYKQPRICVIATGDEVVAPGLPLPEGKLYASNVTAICAWLTRFGFPFDIAYAGDTKEEILTILREHLVTADAFITSGGVWGSEKDMMLRVLADLKWQGLYHRVRMGPGKALAFGLLENKPVFCLPGGPPSNEMAFLEIALPGLFHMRGQIRKPFPLIQATLTQDIRGDESWTQFLHALVEKGPMGLTVRPLIQGSRLQCMAEKNALITLPEGLNHIPSGSTVSAQLLDSQVLCV